MNNSNNTDAASLSNKSIFGPPNFDLFNFSEPVAPSVVNLSTHILTQAQRSLLEKGLNFCPTPGEPDMLELHKDMDRLHGLLRLKAFFMKDKVKKSELADTHRAFMDFTYSSKKPSTPDVVRQKSRLAMTSFDSSSTSAAHSQSTPNLLAELEIDLEQGRASDKGFEHRNFSLPSAWEPLGMPPVALEAFQMAKELDLSLLKVHSLPVQNLTREER